MKHPHLAFFALGMAGLACALSTPAATILDTGGFESYNLGAVNGQNGWTDVNAFNQPSKPAVIANAPGGHGKAIQFSNTGGANDLKTESGLQVSFPNLTGQERYVTASFEFYREGSGSYNNLWWWPLGNNPWYGIAWDAGASGNSELLPFGFGVGGASVPMPQNQWVSVELLFDLVQGLGTAHVNGTLVGQNLNIGTGEFAGWFFDDQNTIDPQRSPNGLGEVAWVDNLVIRTEGTRVPDAGATLGLLAASMACLAALRSKLS